MLDETKQTTIKNEIDRFLSGGGMTDKSVLAETPDQHECALQSMRMLTAYQTMRDSQDVNVRGQAAHDMLVYFNDMRKRHPLWIASINRFLDAEHFKGADVHAWARRAWAVYRDWIRGQEQKKLEIEEKRKRDLENFNRKARGQE